MIWENLTTQSIANVDRNTPVVLPMAAIEQHGPHLPLATDRLIGEYFCQQLDKAIPDDVLILPAIAVGCSTHHMDFTGTLTLQHETFIQQAIDVIDSVVKHGFMQLILLNSHGGNLGSGQVILEKVGRVYPQCQIVFTTWWQAAHPELMEITQTGPGGVGHAGEFETSLMMVIRPDLVEAPLPVGGNVATYEWANRDMLRSARAGLYRTMKQMTPNGVFGDPTASTPEQGKAITEVVIKALKKMVIDLKG